MYFGYVYKITLPNGKYYIGSKQEATFNESYWGSSSNPIYWKDLEKYGKENCKREILKWCLSFEELVLEEHNFIEENGLSPISYNLTSNTWGGHISKGWHHSEENKQKMKKSKSKEHKRKLSNATKGYIYWTNGKENKMAKECPGEGWIKGRIYFNHNWHWKKKKSEETINKWRKSIIGKYKGKNNPMYGKKKSKETKIKISNSLKGHIPWNKGKKNSPKQIEKFRKSFGKRQWYHSPDNTKQGTFKIGEEPFNWIKGQIKKQRRKQNEQNN